MHEQLRARVVFLGQANGMPSIVHFYWEEWFLSSYITALGDIIRTPLVALPCGFGGPAGVVYLSR